MINMTIGMKFRAHLSHPVREGAEVGRRHILYSTAALILFFSIISYPCSEIYRVKAAAGSYEVSVLGGDGSSLGVGSLQIESLKTKFCRSSSFPYFYVYATDTDIDYSGSLDLTTEGIARINVTGKALSEAKNRKIRLVQCEASGYLELEIPPRSMHDIVWCGLRRKSTGYEGPIYHSTGEARPVIGKVLLLRRK